MNPNRKILVVDDEVLIAEHIADMLRGLGFSLISLAHDLKSVELELKRDLPDLIFLDIRFEDELTGLQIGNMIREKYRIPFVFVTANSESALISKAVSTGPAGYITKPVKPSDLFAVASIVFKDESTEDSWLSFRDGYETVRLKMAEILYAESNGNYCEVYCNDRKYILRQSMEWLTERLPKKEFMRVHRSFLVNLSRVQKFGTKFLFVDGHEIPVSRNVVNELRTRLG